MEIPFAAAVAQRKMVGIPFAAAVAQRKMVGNPLRGSSCTTQNGGIV